VDATPLLWLLSLPLAATVAAGPGPAADSGRFVERTIRVGGTSHRYAVWLPPGHSNGRAWPAIVFLHGAGESGADGWKPTRVGLGPAVVSAPQRWPFVVLFPQKPREDEEWEEREGMVLGVLKRSRREFRLDPGRIALAGLSQGGHGAWVFGARHAALWSCLVPVCGYGRPRTLAGRVATLPLWAFHGALDDQVEPDETRRIVAAVRDERTRRGLDPAAARFTLYPDANHNSWDPAFAEPDLPGWLLSHHR
jgi:predicted peptidase